MGDAGSLFLGFMLSVLLLKLRTQAPTRVEIAVILAVPGVAIFDTTLVMVSRVAQRRNPFNGGQDHTSHRLVYCGLSVRQAVGLTYLTGAVLGGAAITMTQFPSARIVGVFGLLAAAALAAVPLYRVPVYKLPWAQSKDPKNATGVDGGTSPSQPSPVEELKLPEPGSDPLPRAPAKA
jgi:UDP-GlcNAc:undecaprenyl-phosphate GlcNAc-1-phosphate transferase